MERRVKKKKKQEGEANLEAWLLSYADMMTLIACFFILMMAFANYDPVGFNKKAREVSKHFQKGKYKPSKNKLDYLTEEIALHPNLKKKTKITKLDSEIIISFSGTVLFGEGKIKIKEENMPVLDTLVDLIRTKDPNFKIIIEGHSDPIEYRKAKGISSTWELGAVRASKILERFVEQGIIPKQMTAITRGDSRPLVKPYDEDGNLIPEANVNNRRVLIRVLESQDQTKQKKFGLGVYFED